MTSVGRRSIALALERWRRPRRASEAERLRRRTWRPSAAERLRWRSSDGDGHGMRRRPTDRGDFFGASAMATAMACVGSLPIAAVALALERWRRPWRASAAERLRWPLSDSDGHGVRRPPSDCVGPRAMANAMACVGGRAMALATAMMRLRWPLIDGWPSSESIVLARDRR